MLKYLLLLLIPVRSYAEEINLNNLDPLKGANVLEIISGILEFLRLAAAIVLPIMVIVGAYFILFSAGTPEKVKKGRDTILYSVIGFIIILMAEGIVAIVQRILLTS
ncbi:MAG: hypothetical protein COU06_00175 [Candidatus Harrisonbacteria bacterium CG10_big_fil_rev_8_21_14_0_10_38_8]|uniref:TrbC/VIRB2 family protein n=1 Tax=Candidatus Harrisonbacteria bacterium CG10_big_fil_rev_8_21_14_0_10_38_8 TaxID=1974582 RepID=A0A2M6WKW8_9BACT|nr:MAG: hypothetical protein COU06_00175 [Candidatus Harrisonbacteria bacterium CG10_big_fil_rev_8_21_14_0_10_38_8]